MKLPNDLIKATDYEKAKNREIHEFECVQGKYIQHYVLGGEHELTEQEVVDCLNGLVTIDCDLGTAYAYIEGQKETIANLEQQLKEKTEILNELLKGDREDVKKLSDEIKKLKLQLFAFVRNSAIAPVGLKLNKTQQEITDKTFETIREANKVISVEKMRAYMNLATNKEDRYDN